MVKNSFAIKMMAALAIGLAIASSAFGQSRSVYSEGTVQVPSQSVVVATVLQWTEVKVQTQQNTKYAGVAAGSALGGGLGAAVGGKPSTKAILGLVGAVLGGLGGQEAAERLGGAKAYEYFLKTEGDSRRRSEVIMITQPEPQRSLNAGDQVYLVATRGTWRIVAVANTTVPAAPVAQPVPMESRDNSMTADNHFAPRGEASY